MARKIRSEEDYLVAGRSLGYGLAVFTIFATWFGAETVVGAAGAIYEHGLSGGSADPFGYGLCILFMGAAFAVPLWRRKLTTFADLFRERFSVGVERLAVILMVPTSILWSAAQVRAFGQVLSASSDLEVDVTITIAAAVVIVYTVAGGLLADVWTDLIQGIALILGLLVLAVAMAMAGGGEVLREVSRVDPSRFALFGGGEIPLIEVLESWAIPIFGSVVAAELVARVIAARSATVARNACFIGGGLYMLVGIIPVGLGFIGTRLVPGLEHGEQVLPHLAAQYLPALVFAAFTGALLSAILSTADSALLIAAGLVSHNVVVPLRGGMTERGKIWTARAGVILFGIAAWWIALSAEGVFHLVQQASAFGSAGIFVITVFGLFTRLGGPIAAHAALVAGVVVWVIGGYVIEMPGAYLAALGTAVAAYAAGALRDGARSRGALSGSRPHPS